MSFSNLNYPTLNILERQEKIIYVTGKLIILIKSFDTYDLKLLRLLFLNIFISDLTFKKKIKE